MTTMTIPDLADGLRVAVLRGARRLRQHGTGVSNSQLSVLAMIERNGPQTLGALAEFDAVTAPTMTRTVGCLVEAGLASRCVHPDDARSALIGLTDAGRDAVRESRQLRNALVQEELERLSNADRATLMAALPLLRQVLQ